jgi:hypothetical protein
MSRYVAYSVATAVVTPGDLKRAALLFDELRLVYHELAASSYRYRAGGVDVRRTVELLQEMGIASIYRITNDGDQGLGPDRVHLTVESGTGAETHSVFSLPRPTAGTYDQPAGGSAGQTIRDVSQVGHQRQVVVARYLAATGAQLGQQDASATLFAPPDVVARWMDRFGVWPYATASDRSTLEVVINVMPVPDDTTPWEAIRDWRADDAASVKRRRLRHWMSNTVGGERAPKDLEDHLLTLLDDYRAQMHLHRMKVRTARTKSIVVPLLETVRNVFTGRWGEWAKSAFTVVEQRHALLEAELNAPGREVAYIVDTQDRFGRRG